MIIALVCSHAPLENELKAVSFFRGDVECVAAHRVQEARVMAIAARPDLVVVDRDLPGADELITSLRDEPSTRRVPIVVIARGDFSVEDVSLLSAGANAVLRLPPSPEWDSRIEEILDVPTRKETRVPVSLTFEARFRTERVPGRVLNLSATGMLVECSASLAVGSQITFNFEMSGFETSTGEVEGKGRVVREAGPDRYAVLFTSIDEVGRELLRRFLLVP